MADRDPISGKFVEGNAAATGHRRPHAAKAAELRTQLFQTVTPERLQGVLLALLKEALAGDVGACRLLLQYGLGDPIPEDVLARLEDIEAVVEERGGPRWN